MNEPRFEIGETYKVWLAGVKVNVLVVGFLQNGVLSTQPSEFVSIINAEDPLRALQINVHQSVLQENSGKKLKNKWVLGKASSDETEE